MSARGTGRRMRLARAEVYLHFYRHGAFPMCAQQGGDVAFYVPQERALLALDERFHVARSLRQRVRSGRFTLTCDRAFRKTIRRCAQVPRPGAWLCEEIIETFEALHDMGHAHSIEAWRDGVLVGGLYGLAIGGAFCGESMFSMPGLGGTDASKVCLVHLVHHLRSRGFTLLDSQIVNDHTRQFRPLLMPHEAYMRELDRVKDKRVEWGEFDPRRAVRELG